MNTISCTSCGKDAPEGNHDGWFGVKDNLGFTHLCPKCKLFLSVLIVDDDETIAEVTRDSLMAQGFAPWYATTQAGAVQLMNFLKPSLLILDLQGGDIDRDTLKLLAKQYNTSVITISGNVDAKPDLAKPFTVKQLVAKMEYA